MIRKIGRNDPCPCGSGRKYKKCCEGSGHHINQEDVSREELLDMKTGTLFDDYMLLFEIVSMFGEEFIKIGRGKEELQATRDDVISRLRPGEKDGIPLSLFTTWIYLDFTFGDPLETVCERFLFSPMINKLEPPCPELIEHLSDSYSAFYILKVILDEWMFFEELVTGREWKVRRLQDGSEDESIIGEIWYVRFVGTPDEAYVFTQPYFFDPKDRKLFEDALKKHMKVYRKEVKIIGLSKEQVLKNSCKEAGWFWSEYMFRASGLSVKGVGKNIDKIKTGPTEFQNIDGEPLSFSKVHFKINNFDGLERKLSSLSNVDYDEKNKTWIWYRKNRKKSTLLPTTSLGTIAIRDGDLIGETNSVERALKLRDKLKKELKRFVAYKKIESRDMSDMSLPSQEEMKLFEEQQKELHKNPEIRKILKQKAEEYYHNDWLKQKIPALGHKTPFQAMKTPEGQAMVEKLIDNLEVLQDTRPDEPFRVDCNGLRKKVGLPEKKGPVYEH
ncbi:SEC-C metal-binding domain-containing protein [Chlamydiota bacterium]